MADKLRARRKAPPPPRAAWAYFFDIDGTLVEIAATPEMVVIHDDLPELIAALHFLTGGAVALLTGRAIADVDHLLPLQEIPIAGQHGLEFRTKEGSIVRPSGGEEISGAVISALEDAAARHPGLFPEFKGSSVALHYRAAPRLGPYAHRLMRALAVNHAPGFVLQKGKRVIELIPEATDKGSALRRLMSTQPFTGRLAVVVGDDLTDEAAFGAVNEMGGHSIKVGGGRTTAEFRLRDVTAVRRWLHSGIDATFAESASMR